MVLPRKEGQAALAAGDNFGTCFPAQAPGGASSQSSRLTGGHPKIPLASGMPDEAWIALTHYQLQCNVDSRAATVSY